MQNRLTKQEESFSVLLLNKESAAPQFRVILNHNTVKYGNNSHKTSLERSEIPVASAIYMTQPSRRRRLLKGIENEWVERREDT